MTKSMLPEAAHLAFPFLFCPEMYIFKIYMVISAKYLLWGRCATFIRMLCLLCHTRKGVSPRVFVIVGGVHEPIMVQLTAVAPTRDLEKLHLHVVLHKSTKPDNLAYLAFSK